jgi:hypothetical protein
MQRLDLQGNQALWEADAEVRVEEESGAPKAHAMVPQISWDDFV